MSLPDPLLSGTNNVPQQSFVRIPALYLKLEKLVLNANLFAGVRSGERFQELLNILNCFQ